MLIYARATQWAGEEDGRKGRDAPTLYSAPWGRISMLLADMSRASARLGAAKAVLGLSRDFMRALNAR
jgi:hypothetical protein